MSSPQAAAMVSMATATPLEPGAPAAPAGESSAMPVALMNKEFVDPQTGQVIPHSTILQNLEILDQVLAKFVEGSIYHKVLKESSGTYQEKRAIAVKASNDYAGGSHTQIWDTLCLQKVVVSMHVTGPPAMDKDEARKNEVKLRCAIWRIDKTLTPEIQDVWTSLKELGTLQQTFIYVRFPYHLAAAVQRLAICLSTFSVESHGFSARVVFEGRAQLQPQWTDVEPWEITVNGNKLPDMTPEDIADARAKPKDTALNRFVTTMSVQCNKSIKDAEGEEVDLEKYLYNFEIEHLKKMVAWHYSEKLCVHDGKSIADVYFQVCGSIIHAVNTGNDKPTNDLCLYTAKQTVEYPDNRLFLSFQKGDTFLALDAPFFAHMDPGDSLQQDHELGIKIVYVLKFAIEDKKGMNFLNAGAVFHQLLDARGHTTMLHILSAIMSPKMAKFAGEIASSQVAAVSSSSSQPPHSPHGFDVIQDGTDN